MEIQMTNPEVPTVFRLDDDVIFQMTLQRYRISGIDNKKLAKEIIKKSTGKRLSKDIRFSRFEDTAFYTPGGSESSKLMDALSSFFSNIGYTTIGKTWTQIHKPLENTDWHNHKLNMFGFENCLAWVYYAQVPDDAGQIVFGTSALDLVKSFPCSTGVMYMFPCWLFHKVTKNLNKKKERVVISGNIMPFKGNEKLISIVQQISKLDYGCEDCKEPDCDCHDCEKEHKHGE